MTSNASGSGDGGAPGSGAASPRPSAIDLDSVLTAAASMPPPEEIVDAGDQAKRDSEAASTAMLAGYVGLSDGLGALLHGGGDVTNATFPTFAAWTTETLRIDVIRNDDGRPTGPQGLRPGRILYQRVANRLLGTDAAIAGNLARGEAMIYGEIGLAVRELVDTIVNELRARAGGHVPWGEVWDAYKARQAAAWKELQTQRAQQADADQIDTVLLAVLQEAVLPYFSVVAEGLADKDIDGAGRKRRAELILLGTIRLEAYAQTRLQPVLQRNLSYVPDALEAMIGSRITGRTNRSTVQLRRLYERTKAARRFADEAFAIAATRYVFTLVIGQEVLTLGRDLPVPPPANPVLRDRMPLADQERYVLGSFYPRELQTLRVPAVWTAWQQFDRSITEGSRTAVDDWLRYEERLSFIVNLFRSRQQVSALYSAPGSLPLPATRPRPAPLAPVLPGVSDPTKTRLTQQCG